MNDMPKITSPKPSNAVLPNNHPTQHYAKHKNVMANLTSPKPGYPLLPNNDQTQHYTRHGNALAKLTSPKPAYHLLPNNHPTQHYTKHGKRYAKTNMSQTEQCCSSQQSPDTTLHQTHKRYAKNINPKQGYHLLTNNDPTQHYVKHTNAMPKLGTNGTQAHTGQWVPDTNGSMVQWTQRAHGPYEPMG